MAAAASMQIIGHLEINLPKDFTAVGSDRP